MLPESIAGAADALDDVRPELLPEGVDVDVDDVRLGVEVVAPDLRQELLPTEDLVRVAEEHLEERELTAGQLDRSVADRRPPGSQVQSDVADPEDVGAGFEGGLDPSLHAREQLVESEGLG